MLGSFLHNSGSRDILSQRKHLSTSSQCQAEGKSSTKASPQGRNIDFLDTRKIINKIIDFQLKFENGLQTQSGVDTCFPFVTVPLIPHAAKQKVVYLSAGFVYDGCFLLVC